VQGFAHLGGDEAGKVVAATNQNVGGPSKQISPVERGRSSPGSVSPFGPLESQPDLGVGVGGVLRDDRKVERVDGLKHERLKKARKFFTEREMGRLVAHPTISQKSTLHMENQQLPAESRQGQVARTAFCQQTICQSTVYFSQAQRGFDQGEAPPRYTPGVLVPLARRVKRRQ
jgi:hypothetical protein